MSNPTPTIKLTTEEGVGLVNTLLPFLEAIAPGVAGGPVGLGISAAVALAPTVIRLISRLASAGAIDAPTQQALLERMADVYEGFDSPTWTTPVIPTGMGSPSPLPSAGPLQSAPA